MPIALITDASPWDPTRFPADALEVRTDPIYAPWDGSAFPAKIIDALDGGRAIEVDASKTLEVVYGPDVIDVTLDLLLDGATGTVNLRNPNGLSRLDFAREMASLADAPAELIIPVGSHEPSVFNWARSGSFLPALQTTLERFVGERRRTRDVVRATERVPAAERLILETANSTH